jgi:probable HAF family extracellular repeat protein
MRHWRISVYVLTIFTASLIAVAQPVGSLNSMKLLTSHIGWAASEGHLLWTTTGGEKWDDITPQMSVQQKIGGVFFLNTSTGWVLISGSDENDEQQFQLAFTDNAGATWSTKSLMVPWTRYPEDFSGGGSVYFVDRLHGWMVLEILSAALAPGRMLFTEDAGKTWNATADDPGRRGSFCFFGKRDGVLAGGPQDTELWITHDDSKSWQQVSLAPPSQASSADFATYGAPVCEDNKHGFLPVTFTPTVYPAQESSSTVLVLFATDNAGRDWKVNRVLFGLPDVSHGYTVATSIMGPNLIAATKTQHRTTLFTVDLHDTISQTSTTVLGTVSKLSFVDNSYGWALTADGLFATQEGGTSWQKILANNLDDFRADLRQETSAKVVPATPSSQAPAKGNYSEASNSQATDVRLGFDTKLVPSSTAMLAWWQYGPYYDYQISLPGAANHKKNPGLTSDWITAVEHYGWGLWPVWVGPQAPCVNQKGLVLINPKNPYKQGQTQAALAITALTRLSSGFVGSIIYYDMENYNTSNANCRSIVRDFLNGWVNGLQSNGYKVGVYGNIAPTALDFSKLNPLPDDVWITWGPVNAPPNIPHVSIWGLATRTASLCDPFSKKSCALWSTSQRIHQYVIDTKAFPHVENWGGTQLEIDPDVLDAAVAVPSTGGKTYNFSYSSIDYPGADGTAAYGVNNEGQIVGGSYVATNNGNIWQGFLYSNGAFTTIDYPGAADTGAVGINDKGQIVGWYEDTVGNEHGFLYSDDQFTSIDLGDKTDTQAYGINDDGQIVGFYEVSQGVVAFFLYNSSTGVVTVDSCANYGINGDALAVGALSLYDAVTGNCAGLPYNSRVLNNSIEISANTTAAILYDYVSGTVTPIAYTNAYSTFVWGLNDYGLNADGLNANIQVVGGYMQTPYGNTHGFVATSNQ